MVTRNWPISGLSGCETHDDIGHRAAMKAAGWLPAAIVTPVLRPGRRPTRANLVETDEGRTRCQVGDRVLVSLSNGHEEWAVVVWIYKNGSRRLKRDDGSPCNNQNPTSLWVKAVDR
jgi:hypothetical protein